MKFQAVYEQLASIAEVLNTLSEPTATEPRYHALAGALFWDDERPGVSERKPFETWSALRYIFRFRTTLILGTPEEQYRGLWEFAKTQFPNWVGFDPRRCEHNEQLAETYRALDDESMIKMEKLFGSPKTE